MPVFHWEAQTLPGYGQPERDAEVAWRAGVEALRAPIALPAALETRLHGDDRDTWRRALEALERYHLSAEAAVPRATLRWPVIDRCDALTGAARPPLPLAWPVRMQRLLQMQREVLWRLGRLELAARGLLSGLDAVTDAFDPEHAPEARRALLEPVAQIRQRLRAHDAPETRPDGDWLRGDLRARFARHRPLLLFIDHLDEALLDWRRRVEPDARWHHVARVTDPLAQALVAWRDADRALSEAVGDLAAGHKQLHQQLAPLPVDAPEVQHCVVQHLALSARSSQVFDAVLEMQHELALAARSTRRLLASLRRDAGPQPSARHARDIQGLERLLVAIDDHARALMRFESILLERWDASSRALWTTLFPELSDALDHPSRPVRADPALWRQRFFALRERALPRARRRPEPEPLQPTRRRRPQEPYICDILDMARAPAAVAQIEQGLLAISELDAHTHRVHDHIARACRQGHCLQLPPPDVPHSPRDSDLFTLWGARAVAERTLGHNLLVIELTRLHLARHTQRLAQIHAWVAEHSSIDSSWPLLHRWDETWGLYTSTHGSYLKFLRRLIDLLDATRRAPSPGDAHPLSDRLRDLLVHQQDLVALTIDYARFIDRGGAPPTPLATLLDEWSQLHRALLDIEAATLTRDAALVEAPQPQP